MYQQDLVNIARADAARAYAAQYGSPMKGYTSPEQIEAARMNALYYNSRPGGMRGSIFEDRPGALTDNIIGQTLGGLGEAFDQKTLLYTAAGAAIGMFALRGKGKAMSLGMGAAAGFLLSKVM